MNSAVQLGMDLRISAERPLVPLEACVVLLDQDCDALLNLIERGALRWAFDIRRESADRREVRVLRDCILSYPLPEKEWQRGGTEAELDDATKNILPPLASEHVAAISTIKVPVLARRFGCEPEHIRNLIKDGSLQITERGT